MKFIFVLALLAPLVACVDPVKESKQLSEVKLNQIQVLGTHNSYSLGLDPQLIAMIEPRAEHSLTRLVENMTIEKRKQWQEYHPYFQKLSFGEGLSYGYPEGLIAQLNAGLRSLELDVYRDPEGGKFLQPAGYEALFKQGIKEDELVWHNKTQLKKPGFKVLHLADIDFRSSCNLFVTCLTQLREFSDANPTHSPIFILLETKDSAFPLLENSTTILPFDVAAFEQLDQEILSVLGRDRLITPDDIRGNYPTLEAGVLAKNWPSLKESQGKFLFLMLTAMDVNGLSGYYENRPNLEGRVAFLRSQPGQSYAAFLLLDNAKVRAAEISKRVKQGYLVRTRADIETYEAKNNDMSRAKAAFASGAQIISTDFYKPSNYYHTNYHVTLPGDKEIICNTVNTNCGK
jgi:hypothetical protein